MEDQDLKITDKRMFTPDGELREEFRHLQEGEASDEPAPPEGDSPEAPEAAAAEPADAATPEPAASPPPPDPEPTPLSEPPPGAPGGAGRRVVFEDLVALLAEHAAISLGDAPLPDGKSMLDLRVAQMHIDLLDVLREKTAGNLTEQQSALMEELLYRLRLVYVEKSREQG